MIPVMFQSPCSHTAVVSGQKGREARVWRPGGWQPECLLYAVPSLGLFCLFPMSLLFQNHPGPGSESTSSRGSSQHVSDAVTSSALWFPSSAFPPHRTSVDYCCVCVYT